MNAIKKFEQDREMFMKGSIHELKTPLMVMDIHINTLLNQNLDDSTKGTMLELYKKVNHMSTLVNEVLKASTLESILNKESIPVKDIINDIIEHYKYMIQDKQLSLSLNLNSSNVEIVKQDFVKVFSNILSNAVKFSKENSVITIDFSHNILVITNTLEKPYNQDLNIFKPFVHHPEYSESHGLGLYVVDMILNKYNFCYDVFYDAHNFTFTINFNKEAVRK